MKYGMIKFALRY